MREKYLGILAILLRLALVFGVYPCTPLAQGAGTMPKHTVLPPVAEGQSLETINRSVAGLIVESSRLVVLPVEGGHIYTAPFQPVEVPVVGGGVVPGVGSGMVPALPAAVKPVGKDVAVATARTREQVFGKVTDQQSYEVTKNFADWHWAGAVSLEGRVLLLDGASLALVEVDPKLLSEIIHRTIPWDRLRPPRDRGGEGTAHEIAELRRVFKREMLATVGDKIVGFAPIPPAWGDPETAKGKRQTYLLATRVKGFPLLEMACSSGEPSECEIIRQCNLSMSGAGANLLSQGHLRGLGISAKRHLLVIGDAQQRELLSFKFNSCFHVPQVATSILPATLKKLTNVTIDADDRLWVTTQAPDDYLNASAFYFTAAEW